jgi:hypothetical protein
MDIEKILEAISTMQADDLNTILDAVQKRLDELSTADPEARALRRSMRDVRKQATSTKVSGKKSIACFMKQHMKVIRGGGK